MPLKVKLLAEDLGAQEPRLAVSSHTLKGSGGWA